MGWRYRALGLIFVLVACSPEVEKNDSVSDLARVIDEVITAQDLMDYEKVLPDYLRSEDEGIEAHRLHLQGLIDKKLLLYEAKKLDLDKFPEVENALSKMVNGRLVEAISSEFVATRDRLTEESLLAAYEEHQMGWQVWPAHIHSASEADAREIIRLLEEGASFSELARERSLADDAEKGGNLGGFFDKGDVVANLREGTFLLEEGQFSEPIRTIDGFEIVKVLKKRRVPFGELRGEIAAQLDQRNGIDRIKAVVDSLKTAWNLRFHSERINKVLDGLYRRGLEPEQAEQVLAEYKGGVIRVSDAVRGLNEVGKGKLPPDSLAALRVFDTMILRDSLLLIEARSKGYHLRDELIEWKEKKRLGLMATQLREDLVEGKVKVTEEEAKARYEKYIDSYKSIPVIIQMTEVLCDTRQEAESILERARNGERLEKLAKDHSVRPGMGPIGGHAFADSGKVTIQSLYQSPYRTVFGDSNTKDVGILKGPLEVQNKYSIFRLDQSFEKGIVPYQKVRLRVRASIRRQREADIFEAFLDSLRNTYDGKVEISEAGLLNYTSTR